MDNSASADDPKGRQLYSRIKGIYKDYVDTHGTDHAVIMINKCANHTIKKYLDLDPTTHLVFEDGRFEGDETESDDIPHIKQLQYPLPRKVKRSIEPAAASSIRLALRHAVTGLNEKTKGIRTPQPMKLLSTSPALDHKKVLETLVMIEQSIVPPRGDQTEHSRKWGQTIAAVVQITTSVTTELGILHLLQHQADQSREATADIPLSYAEMYLAPSSVPDYITGCPDAMFPTLLKCLSQLIVHLGRPAQGSNCVSPLFGLHLLLKFTSLWQSAKDSLKDKNERSFRHFLDPDGTSNKMTTILRQGVLKYLLSPTSKSPNSSEQKVQMAEISKSLSTWISKVHSLGKTISKVLHGCESLLPLLSSRNYVTRFTHITNPVAESLNKMIHSSLSSTQGAGKLGTNLQKRVLDVLEHSGGRVSLYLDRSYSGFADTEWAALGSTEQAVEHVLSVIDHV